jgi:hypothetical protein
MALGFGLDTTSLGGSFFFFLTLSASLGLQMLC